MSKKHDLPEMAPKFQEAHIVTMAVTVISGLISTTAACYHLFADLKVSPQEVKWLLIGLAGLFTFGMAMTPIALARAHGESLEGSNPQTAIFLIVLMVMCIDGALQVHAAHYIIKLMGLTPPPVWVLCIGAGLFQMSMFLIRGSLYAASKEIQDLINARNERLAAIAAREREEALAKRREQYHENKHLKSIQGGKS